MYKSTTFLLLVATIFSANILAQSEEITFNFYGQDAATSASVNLEMVKVKNLSKDCDTVIFGPDPQLILWVSDINEFETQDFSIGNSYPNPFAGTTNFDIQINKPEDVEIKLISIQGIIVAEYSSFLLNGTHSFKVSVSNEGLFYAEISMHNTKRTIKLISSSPVSVNKYSISYEGANNNKPKLKNGLKKLGFVFEPGDELQIIASAESYPDEVIIDLPQTNKDFTFEMRPVPIANFSVNKSSGAFPFITSFTDVSERNPTSWNWNFGDGWLSTMQHNTHTFESSGYYTVSLIAGNEFGYDTLTIEDFIYVKDIELFCDTVNGYAPLLVNFNGICNIPDITSWTWDFGDGEFSNDQNPSHIYLDAASYNHAKVSVTSGGNVYSDSTIIHVFADLAEVNFVADITDGWVPQTIQFTSYTNQTNPIGYQWSFGDGNVSSEVNPVHSYDNIGTFTVILTVYDNTGYKTETKEDYITIRFCPGAVQDVEGNIYGTTGIGTLCWMSENLNIGTRIDAEFGAQTNNNIAEKYCYDEDEDNCDEYGGLYDWNELMQYSTVEGTQGLCPDDWHVSTENEWWSMIDFLGGAYAAAYKIKSTSGWNNNGNGNNESGFNALPTGVFGTQEEFAGIGSLTGFWAVYDNEHYGLFLYSAGNIANYNSITQMGMTVRCVKDNTLK